MDFWPYGVFAVRNNRRMKFSPYLTPPVESAVTFLINHHCIHINIEQGGRHNASLPEACPYGEPVTIYPVQTDATAYSAVPNPEQLCYCCWCAIIYFGNLSHSFPPCRVTRFLQDHECTTNWQAIFPPIFQYLSQGRYLVHSGST